MREWTFTLPSELSHWELESWWTPKFSKGDWKVKINWIEQLFISFRKLLEHTCLKWSCMIHLDTSNKNYGQKKGWESKCHFDSRPLKVMNRPDIFVCRWCATYHCKDIDKGYNFALDFISIRDFQKTLWASKVAGVLMSRISRLQLGSPRTKWHLDVGPVARHREYYKGNVAY